MTARMMKHLCSTAECPYVGKPSPDNCTCHQTEITRLRAEIEQCHAKATCCCGSYVMKHNQGDGHAPVSMYDYALDNAQNENVRLRASHAELLGALKKAKPLIGALAAGPDQSSATRALRTKFYTDIEQAIANAEKVT